jgi:transcriptional regulator with XRE-family HTH domain
MAGRPTVLTDHARKQLDRMLDARVNQDIAARGLGISRRTVSRYAAERRKPPPPPQTLEELLAELPTLDEILAELEQLPGLDEILAELDLKQPG